MENALRQQSCKYDTTYQRSAESFQKQYAEKIVDIEELYQEGKQSCFCPFYLGRDTLRFAHVVFLSYNYLFNDGFRDTIDPYLENSIIIFDEAHNVPGSAEENQSFELDNIMLAQASTEIKDLLKYMNQKKTSHLIPERENMVFAELKTMNELCESLQNFLSALA